MGTLSLMLCGCLVAFAAQESQLMPAVPRFADAVQGCSDLGGSLAGKTTAEQSLVASIARVSTN